MKSAVLFLAVLLSSPAWATWTLTQVKDNASCSGSGSTCTVTVTSTGSGHALIAGYIGPNSSTIAISSVTSGACAVAWVHCSNCSIANSSTGGTDLSYCTSSVSGQTSIVITLASSPAATWQAFIWEASSSLGNIAIDSGATPSGTKLDSTSCTSCAGVALTLSGNNDFIAALGPAGGTATGLTGTGCTNDLSDPGGDGVAHCIVSGSGTYPTTWTQSSGKFVSNALALQESSGGGGSTCVPSMTMTGVGCL